MLSSWPELWHCVSNFHLYRPRKLPSFVPYNNVQCFIAEPLLRCDTWTANCRIFFVVHHVRLWCCTLTCRRLFNINTIVYCLFSYHGHFGLLLHMVVYSVVILCSFCYPGYSGCLWRMVAYSVAILCSLCYYGYFGCLWRLVVYSLVYLVLMIAGFKWLVSWPQMGFVHRPFATVTRQ